ncbi:hypothetical protein B484DRAFT_419754 [Ochromonadaceae sp. CCMP2298]|nr:hypothetical protein B484DRAFT_419754 [Ochromonadaceae sp. CCMP2298]
MRRHRWGSVEEAVDNAVASIHSMFGNQGMEGGQGNQATEGNGGIEQGRDPDAGASGAGVDACVSKGVAPKTKRLLWVNLDSPVLYQNRSPSASPGPSPSCSASASASSEDGSVNNFSSIHRHAHMHHHHDTRTDSLLEVVDEAAQRLYAAVPRSGGVGGVGGGGGEGGGGGVGAGPGRTLLLVLTQGGFQTARQLIARKLRWRWEEGQLKRRQSVVPGPRVQWDGRVDEARLIAAAAHAIAGAVFVTQK